MFNSINQLLCSNTSQNNKNKLLNNINNKKTLHNINCIYGLDNKQFDGYIKIGSTNNPSNRKWDYQTSSPFSYKYLWIFYLDSFDCNLFDDILKYELRDFNVKSEKHVGIEFYKMKKYTYIETILQKYNIKYNLELGDKFLKKIDSPSSVSNENTNFVTNTNMDSKIQQMMDLFNSFTPEQKKLMQSQLIPSQSIQPDSDIDISNYQYQFMTNRLSKINIDYSKFKAQCIQFFVDKINENIKNIIILGLVQSGKTNEIIGIIQFCVVYLKIPIIVLIQNRTSGYKQLEARIKDFSDKLDYYNIKTRYVKTGLTKRSSKLIFDYNNPCADVIICLSNYKQLQKMVDNIENTSVLSKSKIAPYILIMDEYDDHIKTRQDETNIENYKVVEKSIKYLIEKSYINVGVTATLLACMLTDNETTVDDIFQLNPSENYVGYNSKQIKIIDIKENIIDANNKRILHILNISDILQQIDNSIETSTTKDYSITLINITDNTKKHDEIFEEIQNEFTDWCAVLFNSSGDSIKCSLPTEIFSDKKFIVGTYVDKKYPNKIIEINQSKIKISVTDECYQYMPKDKQYVYRYSISFQNYSISEIITHLFTYTNKIAIISGRMACRGISFVTTDFKKHITDMIYVPSGSSHLTRNVQDMRIYGNYPDDNIDIHLYTDKENYITNIGGYILLQTKILNGELDGINDNVNEHLVQDKTITLSQQIMSQVFNPEEVPEKKMDRIGLIKGFKFKNEDKWGIPTNMTDYELCLHTLSEKYPEYDIICYSKNMEIDLTYVSHGRINGSFIVPTKENMLSNEYTKIFKKTFMNSIQMLANTFIKSGEDIEEYNLNGDFNQCYIYTNFRNGWPLYNPLKNKRDLINLCYMGIETEDKMNLIIKNPKIDKAFLESCVGQKTLLIFYGRNSYHYTKCDKESYYLSDVPKHK